MHHFVGTQYRIGRASLDAQRATNAPSLVDDGHMPRAFHAVRGVQGLNRLARQCGQAFNAGLPTGRALVDGGLPLGHGAGVTGAVGKAATRALGLRQRVVQPLKKRLGFRRSGGRSGHKP